MSDSIKDKFLEAYELSLDDLAKVSGGNFHSHPTECQKCHGFYTGDSCPICSQPSTSITHDVPWKS